MYGGRTQPKKKSLVKLVKDQIIKCLDPNLPKLTWWVGGWMGGYIAGNNNPENPSWSRMWQYFDRFQNVLVLIYLLSCNEGIEIFLGCDLKVVDNSDFAVPLGWYSYIITFYKICSKSRPLLLTLIALNQAG